MELDDKVALPGAEGIDLDLVLAGIGSRGLALMIDLGVQLLVLFLVAVGAGAVGVLGPAVAALAFFGIWFGYPIAMEAFNGGRTLGKLVFGLAVVRPDGSPVTFLAATIRSVVRTVDALPGVFTVGLAAMLLSSRTQRLGDLAAGTLVVRRAREQHGVGGPVAYGAGFGSYGPVAAGAGFAAAGPPPPDVAGWDLSAVDGDEVAVIRAFLGRRHELEPVHRARIAELLAGQVAPKVAGVPLDGGPELLLERIAYAKLYR